MCFCRGCRVRRGCCSRGVKLCCSIEGKRSVGRRRRVGERLWRRGIGWRRGRRGGFGEGRLRIFIAGTLTTPTLDAVPARARRLSVWGDIIRLAAISRAKTAAERCRATVEPNGCLSARASNGGFSGFCAERERARARFLTLRPAVSSFAGESLVRRWPGLDSSGTLRWRKGSLRSRS